MQPLVSVCIVTYNSANYVIETLDSIKNQDYLNIELIISDDCSGDNTVKLCSDWLEKNKSRFYNVSLLQVSANTGVTGNCNRALNVAKGKWIKFLGGDDILLENAISSYVDFVIRNKNIKHCVADRTRFDNVTSNVDSFRSIEISFKNVFFGKNVTAKQQKKILSKIFVGSGPSYFVSTEAIRSVGGFDERFSMQEDYPLFLKIIGSGFKMYYLPQYTVLCRQRSDSIVHTKNDERELLSKHERDMVMNYKFQYRAENLSILWKFLLKISIFMQYSIIKMGNSRDSFASLFLYHFWYIFDPFFMYGRYLKLIDKYFYWLL